MRGLEATPPRVPGDPSEGERVEDAHRVLSIDERCGPVSTAEAFEILSRFVHSHFGDGREKARFSIPANPQRDDDLRLHAFISQAQAREAQTWREAAVLLRAEAERRREIAYTDPSATAENLSVAVALDNFASSFTRRAGREGA